MLFIIIIVHIHSTLLSITIIAITIPISLLLLFDVTDHTVIKSTNHYTHITIIIIIIHNIWLCSRLWNNIDRSANCFSTVIVFVDHFLLLLLLICLGFGWSGYSALYFCILYYVYKNNIYKHRSLFILNAITIIRLIFTIIIFYQYL